MHLHILQHVAFEGPGAIANWAEQRGHTQSVTHLYRPDAALPAAGSFDWLIVLGGPMNIYQEELYGWLRAEKALLRDALQGNATVLGICLGAQLLADALGAPVTANACREIGWFPLQATPQAAQSPLRALPPDGKVLHWHGDTFVLPPGAVALAASAACANQAFWWQQRALGLQFHLETTRAGLSRLIEHCAGELQPAPFVQQPAQLLGEDADFAALHLALYGVLDELAGSIAHCA
jgi:GMP synthase-like glutamine amidotransferase